MTQEASPDLYAIFSVPKDATPEQIKKAYYKLCLKYHPDKLSSRSEEEKEEATKKFQEINLFYSVLNDQEKRKIYDQTGELPDQQFGEGKDSAYFEELWGSKLTLEEIRKFEAEYKGSEEEKSDLLSAYETNQGDMNAIMENVILASYEDEERFISIIKESIKQEAVKDYKKFKTTTTKSAQNKRKKMAELEAKEAEELQQELNLNGENIENENALAQVIQSRMKDRMSSVADMLEEKYGKPKKKRKGKTEEISEPTEEEFQKLQAKLFGKKK